MSKTLLKDTNARIVTRVEVITASPHKILEACENLIDLTAGLLRATASTLNRRFPGIESTNRTHTRRWRKPDESPNSKGASWGAGLLLHKVRGFHQKIAGR